MDNAPQLVFKSRDLNESAAILCVGFDLLSTEEDPNGRVYFVFPDTPELQATVKAYWACTLQVTARYYADAIKTLKNVIYKDKP
jgi:hypothetical protein